MSNKKLKDKVEKEQERRQRLDKEIKRAKEIKAVMDLPGWLHIKQIIDSIARPDRLVVTQAGLKDYDPNMTIIIQGQILGMDSLLKLIELALDKGRRSIVDGQKTK